MHFGNKIQHFDSPFVQKQQVICVRHRPIVGLVSEQAPIFCTVECMHAAVAAWIKDCRYCSIGFWVDVWLIVTAVYVWLNGAFNIAGCGL